MTLREARLYRGLSQGACAKLSGLSQQFISKLELGVLRDMNLRNGIKLAAALRVSPEILDKILTCTRLTHGIGYTEEGPSCHTRYSTQIAAALASTTVVRGRSTLKGSTRARASSPSPDDSGPSLEAPPTVG